MSYETRKQIETLLSAVPESIYNNAWVQDVLALLRTIHEQSYCRLCDSKGFLDTDFPCPRCNISGVLDSQVGTPEGIAETIRNHLHEIYE